MAGTCSEGVAHQAVPGLRFTRGLRDHSCAGQALDRLRGAGDQGRRHDRAIAQPIAHPHLARLWPPHPSASEATFASEVPSRSPASSGLCENVRRVTGSTGNPGLGVWKGRDKVVSGTLASVPARWDSNLHLARSLLLRRFWPGAVQCGLPTEPGARPGSEQRECLRAGRPSAS